MRECWYKITCCKTGFNDVVMPLKPVGRHVIRSWHAVTIMYIKTLILLHITQMRACAYVCIHLFNCESTVLQEISKKFSQFVGRLCNPHRVYFLHSSKWLKKKMFDFMFHFIVFLLKLNSIVPIDKISLQYTVESDTACLMQDTEYLCGSCTYCQSVIHTKPHNDRINYFYTVPKTG